MRALFGRRNGSSRGAERRQRGAGALEMMALVGGFTLLVAGAVTVVAGSNEDRGSFLDTQVERCVGGDGACTGEIKSRGSASGGDRAGLAEAPPAPGSVGSGGGRGESTAAAGGRAAGAGVAAGPSHTSAGVATNESSTLRGRGPAGVRGAESSRAVAGSLLGADSVTSRVQSGLEGAASFVRGGGEFLAGFVRGFVLAGVDLVVATAGLVKTVVSGAAWIAQNPGKTADILGSAAANPGETAAAARATAGAIATGLGAALQRGVDTALHGTPEERGELLGRLTFDVGLVVASGGTGVVSKVSWVNKARVAGTGAKAARAAKVGRAGKLARARTNLPTTVTRAGKTLGQNGRLARRGAARTGQRIVSNERFVRGQRGIARAGRRVRGKAPEAKSLLQSVEELAAGAAYQVVGKPIDRLGSLVFGVGRGTAYVARNPGKLARMGTDVAANPRRTFSAAADVVHNAAWWEVPGVLRWDKGARAKLLHGSRFDRADLTMRTILSANSRWQRSEARRERREKEERERQKRDEPDGPVEELRIVPGL